MKSTPMKIADLAGLPTFDAANIFHLLNSEELLTLADDMELRGLIHPIILWEGHILDGRNRIRAAKLTNLTELATAEFEGDEFEAIDFVVSVNMNRRQLTPGQKAGAAEQLEPLYVEAAKKRMLAGRADPEVDLPQGTDRAPQVREVVAAKTGAAATQVSVMKRLRLNTPELHEKVMTGEITINKAQTELKKLADWDESKDEFTRNFPEAWEKYRSDELDRYEAHQYAKKLEADQRAEREVKVSQTVLLIEGLAYLVERQVGDINLSIGTQVQTNAEVEQVLAHISDIFAYLAVTKNALELRRAELKKEEAR